MDLLLFALIFWVAPIIVGSLIGEKKGRAGWAWGFFLGWIGIVALVFLSDRRPESKRVPGTASTNRGIRHWRKMTWALVGWTVLMWAWIIGGAVAAQDSASEAEIQSCMSGGFISREECEQLLEAGGDIGTGIGVGLLILLWVIGFVILSLIWLMTRREGTRTPQFVVGEATEEADLTRSPTVAADTRLCPVCGEAIRAAARVCRFCRYRFPEVGDSDAATETLKTCPNCGEAIKPAARVCRFCRYRFEVVQVSESGERESG